MKLFDPPILCGKYLSTTVAQAKGEDGDVTCPVLESGWLTTGSMCRRLKERLAKYLQCSSKQISLTSSATAGFQAVLDYLHNERGLDWVNITDATWPGMHQAIFHAGMLRGAGEVHVFTHIGGPLESDGSPDPAAPCSVNILDACHSWVCPPSWADFVLYSFYPTKLVPGCEGGVVVSKDPDMAVAIDDWSYCGLRPGEAGQGRQPRVCGRKANMTDVAAALNLEALELSTDYRRDISAAWCKLAVAADRWKVAYRMQPVAGAYLFQLEHADVPVLRLALASRGIPTAWNFYPAPLVTLPMWPCMTEYEANWIIHQVVEAMK